MAPIEKICFICNKRFRTLKEMNDHFKSEEHKKAYFEEWNHKYKDLPNK